MALRPPEPGSFERQLQAVRVPVEGLVRLSRWPASEPFWSRGMHRFDDPQGDGDAGTGFGVCYAASTLDVAFAESVIHGAGRHVAGRFEVPLAELTGRQVVRFTLQPHRPLRLVDLCGRALKVLGLDNDISSGDDYRVPQAWARAIHDADGRWDGIRYVSRQMNRGYAYALFQRSGLQRAGSAVLSRAQLNALCDRFHVAVV